MKVRSEGKELKHVSELSGPGLVTVHTAGGHTHHFIDAISYWAHTPTGPVVRVLAEDGQISITFPREQVVCVDARRAALTEEGGECST